MTARTAERITGLTVRVVPPTRTCYGLFLEGQPSPIFTAQDRSPASAIRALVDWNYQRTKLRVFAEQNYRCWACWRIRPLTADHIRPRGQGRWDGRLNLRGLCSPCHEDHTYNRPISLHPKMAELMSKIGLRWEGEWQGHLQPFGWQKIVS